MYVLENFYLDDFLYENDVLHAPNVYRLEKLALYIFFNSIKGKKFKPLVQFHGKN